MRILLFMLLTVFMIKARGQSFTTYNDAENHFSINIPDWVEIWKK